MGGLAGIPGKFAFHTSFAQFTITALPPLLPMVAPQASAYPFVTIAQRRGNFRQLETGFPALDVLP